MRLDFTRRPVLAIVVSLLIMLLGAIALRQMPVSLFPNVAPPEVNVTVEYAGANAETLTRAAIIPLERAINGVPGMKYMSSDAGNDGVGVVQVLFELGTDPDVAAINVQNRVNAVMGELPEEVIRNGVQIAKEENAMLLYLSIHSDNPEHDEKFLYNFADIQVLGELKRIKGVGFADILGAKEYAIRVWLDPARMAAYGVTSDEVIEALQAFNLEAAPGKLGENSDRARTPLQVTITYGGKFTTPEDYAAIPVRASGDGDILRLGQLAELELGTTFFDVESKFNGRPSAAIMLKQLPGSNANEVIGAIKTRMGELAEERFLPGMSFDVSFDVSRFMEAAMTSVGMTFLEAFLLVVFVVFLFLQDWRTTFIPLLAVPVSLVGTFFFIHQLGFTLNMITLFALVLAIGIVVDDTIVVVEAVHAKLLPGTDPREATRQTMRELTPAIIAITLVMSAVFVPLAFMDGPSGVFYREFALTLAIAIVLSGVVALTLAPALCGSLLRGGTQQPGRFFGAFNRRYAQLEEAYGGVVTRIVAGATVTLLLLVGFSVGSGVLARTTGTGFIPEEDQSFFYVSVLTPAGATLERTKAVVDALVEAGKDLPDIEGIASLAGTNILSDGTGATYGTVLVNLKPWGEREASVAEVMAAYEARTQHLVEAELEFFPPPAIPGYGNASGFELRLLDRTGVGDPHQMGEVLETFVGELLADPRVGSVFTLYNANFPQYEVQVDMDKAARLGVTTAAAMSTLQTLLGSEYATNFIRFGQLSRVMVQAPPEARTEPEDLLRLQVRSAHDTLVPLSSFITLKKTYGPDQVTRYNAYPAAELNGSGAPGVSSGEALAAVAEIAREKLPRGFGIAWSGLSYDEADLGGGAVWVFIICLAFVFLVLAGLYESFALPLAVVLALPPGVFGAFVGLRVMGLDNDVYAHLALILLVGLLGKNAILIIEYAEQRRADGAALVAAAIDASRQRLRPILMTSLAFYVGLLPLAFATGAGAMGKRTVGSAAAAGMVFGTVFGLLLVPGLYVLISRLAGRDRRPEKVGEREAADAVDAPTPLPAIAMVASASASMRGEGA